MRRERGVEGECESREVKCEGCEEGGGDEEGAWVVIVVQYAIFMAGKKGESPLVVSGFGGIDREHRTHSILRCRR